MKKRSQGFYRGLIKGRKEARQGGAMGQLAATKEGHERLSERSKSFVKSQQGWLARHHIADQDHDKIDKVIVSKACAGKADVHLDRFEQPQMRQNLSECSHFSHPVWG